MGWFFGPSKGSIGETIDEKIKAGRPHGGGSASAVQARQAGDESLAAEWEARAAGIWAEIDKAVRLYVKHMQGQAAYVRTGHHGRRVNGVETGSKTPARSRSRSSRSTPAATATPSCTCTSSG